jgi:hypothetical protein
VSGREKRREKVTKSFFAKSRSFRIGSCKKGNLQDVKEGTVKDAESRNREVIYNGYGSQSQYSCSSVL